KIAYPTLYAPESHANALEFNSVQRAHQNTLESLAPTMLLMAMAGLTAPKPAAICGCLWVLSRFMYGYGYAKFGPNGRIAGGLLGYAGLLPLLWMTAKQGMSMVRAI
ncbi:hypothetical protein T492DRAFT_955645, partial [Pavlovales sp. CCMP2436]